MKRIWTREAISENLEPMSRRKREALPFMKTAKHALALCRRTGDDFYLNVFNIECWLGKLACETVVEYAEKKSAGDRRLQTGEARRIFAKVFNEAADRDFPALFEHLTRFAQDDGPYGRVVRQGYWAMAKEAQFPPPSRLLSCDDIRTGIRLQRRFVDRLCDWLEAITHWRIHAHYYVSPVGFDVDPDKRELAVIGWQQRHFSKLDSVSKTYWEWHHSQAAQRFANSDKWVTVGEAMSSQETKYHAYPVVDRLVISLWPLVKKHGWTYRDLLNVIWAITAHDKRYPRRREQELATYCNNVLGLRKDRTGKTSRDGKPEGWKVAIRLCGRR
jgi:hypothetical protein